MNDNAINIPLLRKVMEHITEHPEEYDQREWAVRTDCGTTHCIAGWALALTGHEFTYRRMEAWDYRSAADFGWDGQLGTVASTAAGSTADEAREALGLEWAVAEELFDCTNSLAKVWEIVEDVTDGEIARPPAAS